MKTLTTFKDTPAGTFISLHVEGVDPKTVARCYATERASFYMDLTGHGRDYLTAVRDLQAKVRTEIRRLEANGDRRPSQERRLSILKSFVA